MLFCITLAYKWRLRLWGGRKRDSIIQRKPENRPYALESSEAGKAIDLEYAHLDDKHLHSSIYPIESRNKDR